MNPVSDLLIKLRSYRPREGRDSLEDFVTEVFRWFLEADPGFTRHFLKGIYDEVYKSALEKNEQLPPYVLPEEGVEWQTQYPLKPKRLDMVAKWRGPMVVFEHKVGAPSDPDQLDEYRKLLKERYASCNTLLVLVVKDSESFIEKADLCLCWRQIDQWVDDYLAKVKSSEQDKTPALAFQDLLRYEGIGKMKPISVTDLMYYNKTMEAKQQLEKLYRNLAKEQWVADFGGADYKLVEDGAKWGRIGFYWERDGLEKRCAWSPAITLCTVMSGYDHGISHRLVGDNPLKVHIIISLGRPLHDIYPELDEYRALKTALEEFSKSKGWSLYDHLNDHKRKEGTNRYHPLYLEKSLNDLLDENQEFDKQVEEVRESARQVLEELITLSEFRNFKKALQNQCLEG